MNVVVNVMNKAAVVCSSDLRHHVAVSPHGEELVWSGETSSDQSSPSHLSVSAPDVAPPLGAWDGRVRSGLCGGGGGWRREDKDRDSRLPFNSSTGSL